MKKKYLLFTCFQILAIVAMSQVTIGKNAYVSIEMESTTSPLGEWKKVTQGDSLAIPGASGGMHLEMTGNTPPGGGGPNSPLEYRFKVDVSGKYRLVLRASKRLDGARGDYCNDAFVKLDGNFTSAVNYHSDIYTTEKLKSFIKLYGGPPHPELGWAFKYDIDHKQTDAIYELMAGEEYVFTIAGRSQRFCVDFFVFYNMDIYTEDEVFNTTKFYPVKENRVEVLADVQCLKIGYNAGWDLTKQANCLAQGTIESSRSGFQINTILQPQNEWASAKIIYSGKPGKHNLSLTSLLEIDGESSYQVFVNDKLVLQFENKRIFNTASPDYTPYTVGVKKVDIPANAVIKVYFKSHCNGLVPEGDGFAWARGRWTSLNIGKCVAVNVDKWNKKNAK
jgi:hypothetical protein